MNAYTAWQDITLRCYDPIKCIVTPLFIMYPFMPIYGIINNLIIYQYHFLGKDAKDILQPNYSYTPRRIKIWTVKIHNRDFIQ